MCHILSQGQGVPNQDVFQWWPVATVANVVESEKHRIPIGRHKAHYKEQKGEELEVLNKVYQNGTIA
nr:hypothetical protein CFP56_47072 [Quercus suber]